VTDRDHERFADAVAASALGALDADERAAFEAHLSTCASCREELGAMRRVAAGLAEAVPAEAPPPALRARVLAFATAQAQDPAPAATPSPRVPSADRGRATATGVLDKPRVKGPLPSWVGLTIAATAAVAVLAALYAFALQSQVGSLRQMVSDATDEADRLREELVDVRREQARLIYMVNVATAPDVRRVNLAGQDGFKGSSAFAYVSPTRGIVLNASGLPALSPGQVYQLWVVQGSEVLSGGVFGVDARGAATYSTPLPPNVSKVTALAVSLEPDPGVPARTGPMVLAGN
jgi:anti-sigma-K factor RskA